MGKLLNTTQLARAMGRSRSYVVAMKRSGYEFSHGMLTTVQHANAWLKKHPTFRSSDYRQASSMSDRSPNLSVSGRLCEQ